MICYFLGGYLSKWLIINNHGQEPSPKWGAGLVIKFIHGW